MQSSPTGRSIYHVILLSKSCKINTQDANIKEVIDRYDSF